ncbi:MAG: lysophospholipid acyltransferase family protein [Myxococcota bacterium]
MLLSAVPIDPAVEARVRSLDLGFNEWGIDRYGIEQRELARFFSALRFLYRRYFSVEVLGVENVPKTDGAMIVGNHSGGIAIDATMVIASCFFDLSPPRLAQGMVDKFLGRLPGAAQVATRCGQFAGLPEHAERFLRDGRLLMVFPEGARGTAKLAKDAHSLVRFGTGFARLALKTGVPIVPCAFLGAGEAMPTVRNLSTLGKMLGVPYIPVTRYLLPVPRPAKLTLVYGEPMRLEGTSNEGDHAVGQQVQRVRDRIAALIAQGESHRSAR